MSKHRTAKRRSWGTATGRRKRNYKAEYARRIAKAIAKGLSRSQARGHPKPGERNASRRKRRRLIGDERLQRGLRVLRENQSLSAAARAANVSPEKLRTYALQKGLIERRGRRWTVKRDLPRRILISSDRKPLVITVGDFASASLAGKYMSAVGRFLRTNDRKFLKKFVRRSIGDTTGNRHLFETDPNALYRIAFSGRETFEQVYRIVI
jgi:hypothetical protein